LRQQITVEMQRLSEELIKSWDNVFSLRWSYDTVPLPKLENYITMGSNVVGILAEIYSYTPITSPKGDAPGTIKTRAEITKMLSDICGIDEGLDQVINALTTEKNNCEWAARVFSIQNGDFFKKLSAQQRELLLIRMRELASNKRSRGYATQVLKKLGDTESVHRISQQRKIENQKNYPSRIDTFGEKMANRKGFCKDCGREILLHEALCRMSFEHLDHWTNAEIFEFYCPNCFDDNPDHDNYRERGRLFGNGNKVILKIKRSTSDKSKSYVEDYW
jgi:RNA polymerase-binding transcription factor DksA